VKIKRGVKKGSEAALFHNPDRIAIAIACVMACGIAVGRLQYISLMVRHVEIE
jgi:hypothetical protein